MLKVFPAFAAILAASALVGPTVSQAAEPNSVRVSYADLNLASEAGATVLEKRIAFAAQTVCGGHGLRGLKFTQGARICEALTIADVQPAFNAALAAARNPSVTVLPATITVIAR